MSWIRIRSAGHIERAALEVLGATDKTEQQIGQFGSGIKYALIQALRNGVAVHIHSGWWRCEFTTQPVHVGSKTFSRVVYNYYTTGIEQAHIHESSYSLNAAAEWTKPWFILREFWANALDEDANATMEIVEDLAPPENGWTDVYLEFGPYLEPAWDDRGHWNARHSRELAYPEARSADGTLYKPDCCVGLHVYVKGLLVYHDASMESLFDYDLPSIRDLNEVRQVTDKWRLKEACAKVLAKVATKEACQELLRLFVTQPVESRHLFEYSLSFLSVVRPWKDFLLTLRTNPVLLTVDEGKRSQLLERVRDRGFEPVVGLPSGIVSQLEEAGIPTANTTLAVQDYANADVEALDQARIDKARQILRHILPKHERDIIVSTDVHGGWEFLYGKDNEELAIQLSPEVVRAGTPAVLQALTEARIRMGLEGYGDERDRNVAKLLVATLIQAHHARTGEVIG